MSCGQPLDELWPLEEPWPLEELWPLDEPWPLDELWPLGARKLQKTHYRLPLETQVRVATNVPE